MVTKKQPDGIPERLRIVIVDDHPIVREHLAQLINQESDLTVCAQAEDAPQALTAIAKSHPHLAIVDLSLKGTPGIELIKDLKTRYPRLPVLVLSVYDESRHAERSLRAGARGYIMKEEATEKVMLAIRRVLAGEIYVSDRLTGAMLQRLVRGKAEQSDSPLVQLSEREMQVFETIGRGHGSREVADLLHVSIKTIETHRANIMTKLNITSATELIQRATRWIQTEYAN